MKKLPAKSRLLPKILLLSVFFAAALLTACSKGKNQVETSLDETLIALIDQAFQEDSTCRILSMNGADVSEDVLSLCQVAYDAGNYEEIAGVLGENWYGFEYEGEASGEEPADINVVPIQKSYAQVIDLRPYGGELGLLTYQMSSGYTYDADSGMITGVESCVLSIDPFENEIGLQGAVNDSSTDSYSSGDQQSATFRIIFNFQVTKQSESEPYIFGPFKRSYTVQSGE